VHILHAKRYNARMDGASGTQAVERAITILELFDERRTVLAIADVAKALGVHRSTASRLMATLERRGLLELHEGGAGYRLGLGLVTLAGHVLNRFPVRACAGQVLRELRDQTGETAWLGVLDGHRITYLDQASSPHITVNVDWVGVRQSLIEGVTGRLLLAYQPREVIDRLVAEASPAATGLAETELAGVRRFGYALRIGDGEDGYAGVAVPIRDALGGVVAAISLGGPRFRVSESRLRDELLPAALNAAARVSEALGHRAA
jgi:IclR family transcriptional regulator, acetate operon repressor